MIGRRAAHWQMANWIAIIRKVSTKVEKGRDNCDDGLFYCPECRWEKKITYVLIIS